jgi:glycerol-3-phosphate dehydrogenase
VDDEIRARGSDVAYLLAALDHAFPSLKLQPADVVSTFAGLRPLLSGRGQTPSETSREHTISAGPDGTVVVAGGKLTTLRRMAEETVDRVVEILRGAGLERPLAPCTTSHRPLPGTDRQAQVDQLARGDLAARIDPSLPYRWADLVHAARAEQARRLTDLLIRRVPIFRDAADQGLAAAGPAARLAAAELGWSPARTEEELALYRQAVAVSRRWLNEPIIERS